MTVRNASSLTPQAIMNAIARSISSDSASYLASTRELRTKSVFQLCTVRRSAKPPLTNARTRFSVAAEVL